ncbi:MAG: pantoate--beta-alanine ligase [Chloroflexi bacterium CG08_land_8_20_14_0_20_45_12]|nr:MAG: pantoate--beta-alanine ligase [Dehalococcoidia bacterium CG2_30_46_9]PIU23250.1 MAG: pantoate--beta-alanine ligase [Chloroflexi bacterium CG08_land_8_20_14_0_20_45_12]
MQVVKTISQFRQLRQPVTGSVGFVPTMGYLHKGHLSLVRQARAENSTVVASIFVNPTQFAPAEDFRSYPRDFDRDLALLGKEKTDIVFAPSEEEMYPATFSTWVDVEKVTERLEGACRPGHFRGVATVVTKLFNIVQPTRAYFGQKDAQQALVIKRIVADLNMNTEIVVIPTVRESDGLAMSSRNTYLNPKERQAATVLFKALSLARRLRQDSEKDAEEIRQQMASLILKEPLAQIEYVSIADAETLEELKIIDRQALALLAVRIGKTRLIDNMLLD